MLVLTARIGESFVIDNGTVTVKLLELRGSQVKVGFIADKNVIVDREKIYNAKVQEAIEEKLLRQKIMLQKRGQK